MTFAERGMYLEMLIEQWDKGSLPDCPEACAELLGGTEAEWLEHWSVLRRKFVDRRHRPRPGETEAPMAPDPSRRIINVRLEQYRRRVVALSKVRALAGKNGGLVKAKKAKEIQASNCQDLPEQKLATSSLQVQVQAHVQDHAHAQVQGPPANPRTRALADEPEDLTHRAGTFTTETYPALYAKFRQGARYVSRPALDFQEALELCRTWDDARLAKLATVFLTTDHEFAEKGSRTMAQFRSMASWCDSKLIAYEAQHGEIGVVSR